MTDFILLFPSYAAMIAAFGPLGMTYYEEYDLRDEVIQATTAYAFRWEEDPEIMAPYGGGVAGWLRYTTAGATLPAVLVPYQVTAASVPAEDWA